jgi:hypothetical protein
MIIIQHVCSLLQEGTFGIQVNNTRMQENSDRIYFVTDYQWI